MHDCVDLCNDDDDDDEEQGNDPLIRELDLDVIAARDPADLLESSQHEHTPSDHTPTTTPTPAAHSQVHVLTLGKQVCPTQSQLL